MLFGETTYNIMRLWRTSLVETYYKHVFMSKLVSGGQIIIEEVERLCTPELSNVHLCIA